jgi:hypothetical protein
MFKEWLKFKKINKNVVEIRDLGIRYLEETYSGSRIQPPGVKKSLDPWSRIRNTALAMIT